MENSFEDIWERIKRETGLRSLKSLADIVEISQPAVSEMKSKNKFPAGWAYLVGKKYGLLTEWIMTGKGPKSPNELIKNREFAILDELEEWLKEEVRKNPERKVWFEIHLLDSFKTFKEWKIRKEAGASSGDNYPSSKVA